MVELVVDLGETLSMIFPMESLIPSLARSLEGAQVNSILKGSK